MIGYRHADLADVREALLEVGVPAVIAAAGVFATPRRWVADAPGGAGAAAPQRPRAVRRATCFLGRTAAELAERATT